MNKLFTPRNLLSLCLMFVSLQSCKKDTFKITNNYLENKPTGQISNADIVKWADKNEFVKYLALDWKNAKQTVFKGRQVIKVTLLNEKRLPQKASDGNKETKQSNVTQNSSPDNYFAQHPPEVFLVKDAKDSLHSALLNFIPDDKSKGFGQQGQWTGKLYEWNMKSDTLFVQEIKENKLIKKYILKTPVNITAGQKGVKTESLESFFGSILDFINNIGYFLGIPGTSNHLWYDPNCVGGYDCIRISDWVGDIFGWIGSIFQGLNNPDYVGPWGTQDYGGYYDMNGFYVNYLHSVTGGEGGYTPLSNLLCLNRGIFRFKQCNV